MKIWILVGLLVLLALVVGIIYGIPYLRERNAPTSVTPETEVPVEGLGDLGETADTDQEAPFTLGEGEEPSPEPEAEQTAEPAEEGITIDTGEEADADIDLGPDVEEEIPLDTGSRDIAAVDVATQPPERETRPTDTSAGARPGATDTGTTPPAEDQPETLPTTPPTEDTGQPPETIDMEPGVEATATPLPTTPVATATPAPPSGSYRVRTLQPVVKSQVATIRKAVRPLGVQLREQQSGQQHIQAYRIAVGYFRTKAEAESWAGYNFKPRNIDYYVYLAKGMGMYSIQLGVYTQQQNVELAMRELYRKYQGGRLPVRTEMTSLPTTTYILSTDGIPENLARQVQNTLVQMGIQSELVHI